MELIVAGSVILAVVIFFGVKKLSGEKSHISEKLPEATDRIEIIESEGSGREHDCGHLGPDVYVLSFYGLESKPIDDGKRCPDCFIEWLDPKLIRCCLCRLPIFPGEPIALYAGADGLQKDIATKHDGQWVGCLRWHCAPTGAAYAGNWTGEEVELMFDGLTAAATAMKTGKPVAGSPQEGTVEVIEPEEDCEGG